jgi:hypothetical protein
MTDPLAQSPTAPAAVRLLLLGLLPLIAGLLYLDGQRFDTGLLDLSAGAPGAATDPFPDRVAGLERAGPVRHFDKDNLYEYINGHAEYFIGAGFRTLAVGEYGTGADGQPRVVVNLYDLGTALNAFGVLANEAGDREPEAVGALAFRSGQGVDFIQGPYYAQVSLFDPGLPALETARELAAHLAPRAGGTELAFGFPDLGEVGETRFVREYYRGMEFLNRVLERSFVRDGREIQTFLVSGPDAEIAGIREALLGFLDEEGIAHRTRDEEGLRFQEVQDPYEGEWFFLALPERLVGVFAPLDASLSEDLRRFADQLAGPPSEPRGPAR